MPLATSPPPRATRSGRRRSGRPGRFARSEGLAGVLLLIAGIALAPAPAGAQECAADGSRAKVCSIRLFASQPGERPSELDPQRGISLPLGTEIELDVYGYDQSGRDFPRERLLFGVDTAWDCREVIEIERLEAGSRFRVQAGLRQGRCEARLWLPGNLNLEWPLQFEVVARARTEYSRAEAEYVTSRIYEALLTRAPDAGGLAGHTAEIQRGNLARVIDGILGSAEFQSRRSGKTPAQMLEQIFLGLLGRPPDTPGVRTFLGVAERGDYGTIVWELLRSEEFERRMLTALQ